MDECICQVDVIELASFWLIMGFIVYKIGRIERSLLKIRRSI
jgi:hypothetical protein